LLKPVPSKKSRDNRSAIKRIRGKKYTTLKALDLALIFTPYCYMILC